MATESNEVKAVYAFHAVTSRLDILHEQRILDKLRDEKQLHGYWGTAPTGKPHIGYLVPLVKIAECITAGVKMKILIADCYAFLINHDVSMDVVKHRSQYYEFLVRTVLKTIGIPEHDIHFERQSSYCLTADYSKDVMKCCSVSTQDDLRRVGPEVHGAKVLSPLLCPIYQALDEVYLGTDFQLGGIDQRGVFDYANQVLPKIGHQTGSHLLAAMIPGLKSGKMSSSAPENTKIMFSDTMEVLHGKIMDADWATEDDLPNAIMAMFEYIVFPVRALTKDKLGIDVQSTDTELRQYDCYDKLKEDFDNNLLNPAHLKEVLAMQLNRIIEPIRREYAANGEWHLAEQAAYHSY